MPVTPPFYYLWSMSIAQIELMCADCSVTVYSKTKDGGGKGKREFKDMSADEIESKRKEWEERYGGGKHIIKVNL